MHPNFVLLVLWKKKSLQNFPTVRPKYSEISLKGNTTIFIFTPNSYHGYVKMLLNYEIILNVTPNNTLKSENKNHRILMIFMISKFIKNTA